MELAGDDCCWRARLLHFAACVRGRQRLLGLAGRGLGVGQRVLLLRDVLQPVSVRLDGRW